MLLSFFTYGGQNHHFRQKFTVSALVMHHRRVNELSNLEKYIFTENSPKIWPLAAKIKNFENFEKSYRWRHNDLKWPKLVKIIIKSNIKLELNQKSEKQNAYGILNPNFILPLTVRLPLFHTDPNCTLVGDLTCHQHTKFVTKTPGHQFPSPTSIYPFDLFEPSTFIPVYLPVDFL